MSDEKNLFENEAEVTQEVVEETIAAEPVEEAEVTEVIEETEVQDTTQEVEDVSELTEDVSEEASEDEGKKVYTKVSLIKAVISTLVICVALMVAEYYLLDSRINHYNLNEDGFATTLNDMAEQSSQSLDDLKKEIGLPEDMEGDTMVAVAEGYIKLGKMLEMQGMGEDMIPMFAQMYGIDESKLNKDMYMGEFNKLMIEAQKKAAEEAENAPAEGESAPAEGEVKAEKE